MKRCIICLALFTIVAHAQIAWDVVLPTPPQYSATIYRGEAIYLQPRYLLSGRPIAWTTNAVVTMNWWTNAAQAGIPFALSGSVYTNVSGSVRVLWPATNDITNTDDAWGYVSVQDGNQRLYRAQLRLKFKGAYPTNTMATRTLPNTWDWADQINARVAAALSTGDVDGVTIQFVGGKLTASTSGVDSVARSDNALTSNSIAPAVTAATGDVAVALRAEFPIVAAGSNVTVAAATNAGAVTYTVNAQAGGIITTGTPTLAQAATAGGFAGTEIIQPFAVNAYRYGTNAGLNASGNYRIMVGKDAGRSSSGDYRSDVGVQAGYNSQGTGSCAFGTSAGYGASGAEWMAYGNEAGLNANGNYWSAYGDDCGIASKGNYWNAYGTDSGNACEGDFWAAYGYGVGRSSLWSNSAAFGVYAGFNSRGICQLHIDVYEYADSIATDYSGTNDAIYGDNGQLNLGRTGEFTNAVANRLRGYWDIGTPIGDASLLSGVVLTNDPAMTNARMPTAHTQSSCTITDAVWLVSENDTNALAKLSAHTNATGNVHGLTGGDLAGLGALTNGAPLNAACLTNTSGTAAYTITPANGTATVTRAMGQAVYVAGGAPLTITVQSGDWAATDIGTFALGVYSTGSVTFMSGVMTNTQASLSTTATNNIIFFKGLGTTLWTGR